MRFADAILLLDLERTDRLHKALIAGRVMAWGWNPERKQMVAIPPADWRLWRIGAVTLWHEDIELNDRNTVWSSIQIDDEVLLPFLLNAGAANEQPTLPRRRAPAVQEISEAHAKAARRAPQPLLFQSRNPRCGKTLYQSR